MTIKKQHIHKQISRGGTSKRKPIRKSGILLLLRNREEKFKLKFAEELYKRIDEEICTAFIKENYTTHPSIVYRYSHKPANDRDLLPRLLRNRKDDVEQVINKIEQRLDINRIEEVMYGMSYSCYDTEEHAISAQQKRIDDYYASSKNGPKKARNFAKAMGVFIVREVLYKYDAIATLPDEDGHMNIFLKEGVDWVTRIDSAYGNNGYKKIKYGNV